LDTLGIRERLNGDFVADHVRVNEGHITGSGELTIGNELAKMSLRVEHVQHESLAWWHLRSLVNLHLAGSNSHVALAVDQLQHIGVSGLQELERVSDTVLSADDLNNVATPCTDLFIRRISSTGYTVLTDIATLDPRRVKSSSSVGRRSNSSVTEQQSTSRSYRRTSQNSSCTSCHDLPPKGHTKEAQPQAWSGLENDLVR